MIKNSNHSKIERIKRNTDYFLVLLLVLFSSNANTYFKNPIYALFPILVSFIIYYKRNRKLVKSASYVYFVFILYIGVYFFKWNLSFDPMFSFRMFGYITISHLVLTSVGKKFFIIFENIIYFFAAISIPLMIVQFFAYDQLYSFLRGLQSIMQIPLYDAKYVNVIFYTINSEGWRNCGFMWEPGGFASILSVAIIINLARTKFMLRDKKLIVLITAMLITFSTTGYLALIVIIIWYLLNKKLKRAIVSIPAFAVIIIYISTLPFMTEKINQLSHNADSQYEVSIAAAKNKDFGHSMGRFAGLLMSIDDVKNNPFFGYGGHNTEETIAGKMGIKLGIINGIGHWLGTLGGVGIILFFITYYKSSLYLSQLFQFEYPIFIFAVFMILAFSFGRVFSSLFFAFQLAYLYLPLKRTQ